MFNIGEKDRQGKQKRIEYRGRHLRASRTGGVALRAQTEAAGLNVTANTKHGFRVSTRVAKGTNVAMQSGRLRVRGRYGRGPTKLNLSKSGLTVSTKNKLGTFNWVKPNRSSVKLGGVQVRGKNAATIQMVYLGFMAVGFLIKLAALLVYWVFQILFIGLQYLGIGLWKLGQATAGLVGAGAGALRDRVQHRRLQRLQARGRSLLEQQDANASSWDAERRRAALIYLIVLRGRGRSATAEIPDLADAEASSEKVREVAPLIDGALSAAEKGPAEATRALTAALAARYAELVSGDSLSETLFELDEMSRREGPRTVLQDRLLEAYADGAGLAMTRAPSAEHGPQR